MEEQSEEVTTKDNSTIQEDNLSRRIVLRRIGGGVVAGAAVLEKLNRGILKTASAASPSPVELGDGIVRADLFIGPSGTITINRNPDGSISNLTYDALVETITRNPDGSIASVQYVIDTTTITDTIVRNPDGSIASVLRTG